MDALNRRHFMQTTLAAAATVTVAGTKSSARVRGANDTIRVAVAGLNGRGSAHIDGFAGQKGVQVVCVVDPDTRTFNKRIKQVEKKGGNTPRVEQDIRKALEDKSIDAISIATPNHWHALMTIWGCQAGKDVYVEKPCSHNVHEGRIAVEMARKHNRIVQHGTQSRNSLAWAQIAAVVRSGKLGRLLISRALCYKPRNSIGVKPNSPAPREVDFNLWLGPAAQRDFNGNLVHYNWHWFWDFGNGDIGNQGVHQMDIARWMIPGATLPTSVISLGGRFGYKDQGETPNTQLAFMEFDKTLLTFEVRGLKTDDLRGEKVGNILHLEAGVIAGNRFYPQGSSEAQPLPKVDVAGTRGPGSSIFANFIASVRSRKVQDLNADILDGHYSSALGHLANISYRLGEDAAFPARVSSLGDNKDVLDTIERMQEHLSIGNKIDLKTIQCRMGRKLKIDPKTESIVGDKAASKLLTRDYRKGFEVPAKV
ncbi:MAG: Gfo/Idh/MocA family oxidoreductase [Gemmataceae bacterium]